MAIHLCKNAGRLFPVMLILMAQFIIAHTVSAKSIELTPKPTGENSAEWLSSGQRLFLLKQKAALGDDEAQFQLGAVYAMENNYSEAINWLEKAAAHNHLDALYQLGILLDEGKGTAVDRNRSFKLWQKAAQGDHVLAQLRVADIYAFQHKSKDAPGKAAYWYKRAAEKGHAPAQYNLGVLFEHGRGVKKDISIAIYWWEKAARQGYFYAQHNLGVMYEEGKRVNQSYTQAYQWFKLAAEQGNARSANRLGILYEFGRGVDKDDQAAYMWYALAAQSGLPIAKKNLQRIKQNLSAEMLNRAQIAVNNWLRTHKRRN